MHSPLPAYDPATGVATLPAVVDGVPPVSVQLHAPAPKSEPPEGRQYNPPGRGKVVDFEHPPITLHTDLGYEVHQAADVLARMTRAEVWHEFIALQSIDTNELMAATRYALRLPPDKQVSTLSLMFVPIALAQVALSRGVFLESGVVEAAKLDPLPDGVRPEATFQHVR